MASEDSQPSWWAKHGNTAGLVGLVAVAGLGFLVCPSGEATTPVESGQAASAKNAAAVGEGDGKAVAGEPGGNGNAGDPSKSSQSAASGAEGSAAAEDAEVVAADGVDDARAEEAEQEEAEQTDEDEVEIEQRVDVPAPTPEPDAPDSGDGADTQAADTQDAPSTIKPVNRTGESKLTAEELYAAAKAAYAKREYREAFRLATKSQHAKADDATQALRGKAACQIKDRAAAKKIIKSFKLRDPKRKELRALCKDRGVNVVL